MSTIYDTLVLAKVETTKGTDASPTAANDAVRVQSVTVTKNQEALERAVVKQTMGPLPHLIAKETVQAEIVVQLAGSGAAGTAPEWGALMQACRTAETIVASTSVAYDPSSAEASEKSATIYIYKDGLLWKLLGSVGNVSITADAAGILTATFTMQATYTEPTAVAVPSGAVFDGTEPLVLTHADTVSDGASILVSSISLDAGNNVEHHYTTGQNVYSVSGRNPTMTFTKDSVNTVAEWQALSNGTDAAISATVGTVAGNILTLTAPAGRRQSVGYGERGEKITHEVAYGLFESTSDDQWKVKLT